MKQLNQVNGKLTVGSIIIAVGLTVLVASCGIKSENNQLKDSFGRWKEDSSSIGWIPAKVYRANQTRDRQRERQIRENVSSPNYLSLKQQHLFNQRLLNFPLDKMPWSSGFFPSFFNGVGARWRKSALAELFAANEIASSQKILQRLQAAKRGVLGSQQKLDFMSPIEKYDIGMGDYTLSATRVEKLIRGQDSESIALWSGYCNGISAAAIHLAEPFRAVKVINSDGYAVVFHPYDIKALLGLAYYKIDYGEFARLGNRCKDYVSVEDNGFFDITRSRSDGDDAIVYQRVDDKNCRGINPASFVLALQNRLGIAKTPFIIDKVQGKEVSNHPIGEAIITVLREPYVPTYIEKHGDILSPGTQKIVELEIGLWLGSTALHDSEAVNRTIDSRIGLYKKVGFKPEREDNPRKYYATLELDKWNNIIGGEWGIKDRWGSTYLQSTEAPDFAWFGTKPLLIDAKYTKDITNLRGRAKIDAVKFNEQVRCQVERGDNCDYTLANPRVKWSFLKALYDRSVLTVAASPALPVLDLR